MNLKMIVAIAKDGAIGHQGDLLWHIGADLKRFKTLTMGHPVVMGRKTWESLPKRPLPGRRNIVITNDRSYQAPGAELYHSIQEVGKAIGDEEAYIIGGAKIYEQFLPLTDTILLTEVDAEYPDADTRVMLNYQDWEKVEESEINVEPEGLAYRYLTLQRK